MITRPSRSQTHLHRPRTKLFMLLHIRVCANECLLFILNRAIRCQMCLVIVMHGCASVDIDFGCLSILGPCRAGAFSSDGLLVATGSHDASIKILDVEKMIAKSTGTTEAAQQPLSDAQMHPVIRTLYDHTDEVTCLEFHPTDQILISGSLDYSIKLYDFTKPSVKRALKTISEAAEVRCLAIHPTGNWFCFSVQFH